MIMLDAKGKAVLRREVYGAVGEVELATGFEFAGMGKEGAVFTDGEDSFVVKVVVKNAGYDAAGAVAELEEAEAAKVAAAAEKANKKG